MTRSQISASGWPKRAGRKVKRSTTGHRACQLRTLQDLCRYWTDGYDFEAPGPRASNAHPQFHAHLSTASTSASLHPQLTARRRSAARAHSRVARIVRRVLGRHRAPSTIDHGLDPADTFHVVVPVATGLRIQRPAPLQPVGV